MPRTRPRQPATEEAFAAAWREFFAAVRRARGRAAAEGAQEGLSLAQFQLLVAFEEADELPVGALALAGGVAAPTATRMLDALERDGVVERHASDSDKRVVNVRLTPEGRKLLAAKRRRVAAKQRVVFDRLSPAERSQTIAILHRLAAAVEDL